MVYVICHNIKILLRVIRLLYIYIYDSSGEIICVATQKLFSSYALSREASAALFVCRLVASSSFNNLMLEEDALLVILAMNQTHLFATCNLLLLFQI
jgi:hypothetical protein